MHSTAIYAITRFSFAILIATVVASCGGTGEKVFTRQNQAASALATMVMDAEAKSPAAVDGLYEAESQLHEACAPLREIASRRMTGETVGLDTHLIALVSMDRCESETTRIEEFIRLGNPTVASGFLSPTVDPNAELKTVEIRSADAQAAAK
jgi:hypothetical protein